MIERFVRKTCVSLGLAQPGIAGSGESGQAEGQIFCYGLTGFCNSPAKTPLSKRSTIIVVNTRK